MAKRSRLATLLAKLESTYGSDSTPTTGSDALIAYDLEVSPEIDVLERPDKGISLSRPQELGGKQRQGLKFSTESKGSGSAGTAPKGDSALLQACGFSETVSGGVSVTYKPTSSSFKSNSIHVNLDGLLYKLLGSVGELELSLKAGERPMYNYEMSGLWSTPTDQTFPTSYNPNVTKPKVCKNLTATFDSYAAVIRECTIKMNNVIAERPALAAATGIDGFDIVDRNPTGKIVIDALPLATKDYWAKLVADTVVALSVVLSNGAGNIITISAPYCRIQNIKNGDEDGVLTHEIEFQLARLSGNDELSIVYT